MTVSSIPCEIHHDGDAPVSSYFMSDHTNDKEWPLRTSFRGRGWRGFIHTLSHPGLIFRDGKVVDRFNTIYHYEWDPKDKITAVNFYKALEDMIELSEILNELE